jgi:uncharacterized protein (DUF58 family)
VAFSDWARVEATDANGIARVGARRIYILPTRYGLIYATLLTLMLIGAVNYGNNPAHLLTFLLAGLGSNAMYLTWRNLRRLAVRCDGAAPVFAGRQAVYVVWLDAGERERPAIQLGFDANEVALRDIDPGGAIAVELTVQDLPRGLHNPGRLVISTAYPLGLFRAWCYVEVSPPVLVYPSPGASWHPSGHDGQRRDGGPAGTGNDDFAGLRDYQPGDPPSQIDWKSYARERGLNTRRFSGQASAPVWLDLGQAPGPDEETRLSALTRAVLDAEAAGRHYGLRTPNATIPPGLGDAHRHSCLHHLALYGTADA